MMASSTLLGQFRLLLRLSMTASECVQQYDPNFQADLEMGHTPSEKIRAHGTNYQVERTNFFLMIIGRATRKEAAKVRYR